MKKNKNELIIESFQEMNLDMLEVLLDDNKTYQDARKDIFLEKLNIAFLTFKENGDSHLLPYKGLCNSKICSNKSSTGYSFVGNVSKKHIDLIFQEFDNEINDIFHCSSFQTYDNDIIKSSQISIEIKFDEMANYNPSVEFLIEKHQCKLAIDELCQHQNTIIDKSIYIPWLEKHNKLYNSIDIFLIHYTEFDKFYWLYSRINKLPAFLETHDLAKEAVKRFQFIDPSEEFILLKWLTNYEQTGKALIIFLYEEIDYEHSEKSKFFIVDNLKIDTSDFYNIAKFKFIFDKHYWNMLKKYTTFSDEERLKYMNEDNEMSEHSDSLTYHLIQRGIELK